MTRVMKPVLAAVTAVAMVLLGAAAPAQAAPEGVLGIFNAGQVGSLGIFEHFRASGGADWDATLPQNAWSDDAFDGWDTFGGFFVGSGYCAQRYTSSSRTGPWTRVNPNVNGKARSKTAGNYYVKIVPFRC
jgi:hypothetical protein